MSAWFLSSCHKHWGPFFMSKCQAHCVASLLHDTDLHWMREGGAWRWMIESSADSGAGRQAVAQRPEDHVTNCQGTGFIQWLLAAAQLFHIGRSSNRSLPLKQQPSVVAPEPVLCICCFLGCGACALEFVCAMYPDVYITCARLCCRVHTKRPKGSHGLRDPWFE